MRMLDVSQAMETDAWLEARRGRITGTKSAGLCLEHYARKPQLKVTQDFWNFLAEMLACAPDGEPPIERGHRLENENAMLTLQKIGINPQDAVFDTKMWVSDIDQRIACSPDCHENSDNPTWAIECKSLGSANHLATIIPAMIAKHNTTSEPDDTIIDIAAELCPETMEYDRDFDFIPDKYKHQVVQYFVVNESLETLYFSLYDDRFYTQDLAHYVFVITLETIQAEIEKQLQQELHTLQIVDNITETFGDPL